MGLITTVYTAFATITITLASLADGSWRQSAVVDNTADLRINNRVGGKITTGTTPTVDTYIYVWIAASWNTSDYEADASGSDAAYTPNGSESVLKLVKAIKVDATSNQTYEWSEDLANIFKGQVMPSKYCLIVQNETGAALNSTGGNHDIKRQPYELNAA